MADRIQGITIPIGIDTSEVARSIKDLNKEMSGSFGELSKIEKALKFNPGNTELLSQKMEVLGDVIGKSKDKLELLKKAQEEASKDVDTEKGQEQYRKLTREIIETESKMKLYEDRLKTTNGQLDNQVPKLDKLADGLEKTGEGFKKAGDKMDKVGQGLTKGVTAPILGIGGAAMVAWNEVDEAVDGIIAGTGATGEAAEGLEKSFKNVSKTVPNSLGDVGVAIANLNTKFGLQGEELEDATKAALQYADVNKADVGNAVNSVAKVMAAADIPAKDFNKTLSKLTAASQDSGVSVDDLTAAYEKSGATLRTLGYTFDESISMVAQWEKAGLNAEDMLKGMQKYIVSNDKATEALVKTHDKETEKLKDLNKKLDEVKNTKGKTKDETEKLKKQEEELTKKIKEQEKVVERTGKTLESTTSASREEFDKLVKSIKDMKDPQQQLNKAIDVFGTKNGPAFVDAIKNGKLNYEDFAETVEKSNDRLSDTWEATQDPVDKFKTAINDLKITGSELGGSIQEASIPLIEEFAKKVQELGTWFDSLTDDQKENIIQMGLIIAAAGPVLTIMGKLTTAVGNVATGASSAIRGVSAMFTNGGIFATGGKLAGMAGPIGLATTAVGLLGIALWEIHEPQRIYKKNMKESIGAIEDFSEAVETAKPLIDDFDTYQTRYDQGINDKKASIKKLEPEITTILSDNVKERSKLTDAEMEKLKEYLGLLDSLNDEIAKKYGVRLKVLDQQLSEENNLNATKAAEYIATVNKADEELSKNATENHINKMVQLEAMLENEKNLRQQGKTKEADEERKHYEELKKLADDAMTNELAKINLSTVNRITAIKDKFLQSNAEEVANLKKIGEIRDEEERLEREKAEKIKAVNDDKLLTMEEKNQRILELGTEYTTKIEQNKMKENEIWDENTKEVSGALMNQVANIILHGGEIDKETSAMVDTFMKTMAQSPESAESFKKAMEDSIDAIVEKEPELAGEAEDLVKNFNGTIDDIQNGKFKLGGDTTAELARGIENAKYKVDKAAKNINEGALKGMTADQEKQQELGLNYDRGVAKGIKDNEYLVKRAAERLARNSRTAFDQELEINSPSRVMTKDAKWIPAGVAEGIDKNAWMVEEAMTDLAKIPQEVNWMTDPVTAGDFNRASQPIQPINNYPVINVNNPVIDSPERVRKLAEELYRFEQISGRR